MQAFLEIATDLDMFRGEVTRRRKKLLGRLNLLLKDGARTPFRKYSRSLHLAVLLGEEELLRRLLSEGVDPNESWPRSDWTPLHLAAQKGEAKAVRALLEAKAAILEDRRGLSPLEYASQEDAMEIQEYMRKSSPDGHHGDLR